MGATLWSATPQASAAQGQFAPCTYQLGFADLHSLIPDIVGECAEDQHTDLPTGDALQRTSRGLLVWRKADNWTAFTDGSQSWVNGPLGIQHRTNTQRFWWEGNPDNFPILPPPARGERCHTAGLTLSQDGVDAGAGNFVGTFRFTNQLDVPCTFFGYPGAQLLDAREEPLPTNVVRAGGLFMNNPPPTEVTVGPHGSAIVRIHWEQVPVGNETSCPVSSELAVTPPDEYVSLKLAIMIRACGGGRLDISAVQAP
jgi:hypothetical protein